MKKVREKKTADDERDREISKIKILTGVKLFKTLNGHVYGINALDFLPLDNNLMASGSGDGTIKIWETKDWSMIKPLEGNLGWINIISFGSDGKILVSASMDNTISIRKLFLWRKWCC